jgi:hypothetical protein
MKNMEGTGALDKFGWNVHILVPSIFKNYEQSHFLSQISFFLFFGP